MRLTFHLHDTDFYDCTLHVRDGKGARAYHMNTVAAVGSPVVDTLTVEVTGDTVEVVALPKTNTAMKEELRDCKGDTFLETVTLKALGKAAYTFYRAGFLHAAVTYRLPLRARIGTDAGKSDAIHLHLTERVFCPTPDWMAELLDLYPLGYVFFELGEGDTVYTPAAVRDLNGLELIRFVRKIILMQCAGGGLILYPLLMSRIKRLTRPRVILRKLKKLYRLPPEKRADVFTKSDDEPVIGKL